MTHSVWYDADLRCSCGQHVTRAADTRLYSYRLNPEVRDIRLAPGQTLALDPEDFDDAFKRLRAPAADDRLRALEVWSCPSCGLPEYAILTFVPTPPDDYRLESVEAVDIEPAHVPQLHLVSWRALESLRLQSRAHDAAVLAAIDQAPLA
ncbi:MAG: hypothetical protein ACK5TK_10205 [Betaproteobacteria bacterium]